MILSAQAIRRRCIAPKPMIAPFCERTVIEFRDPSLIRCPKCGGTDCNCLVKCQASYGLSAAGYDIRLAETLSFGKRFQLASSLEEFNMPNDVLGYVKDKSSWARRGLFVQNTVVEPGWRGFLTLELTYDQTARPLDMQQGWPIAQVVFHLLDQPTDQPYSGKYQDQESGPQQAR